MMEELSKEIITHLEESLQIQNEISNVLITNTSDDNLIKENLQLISSKLQTDIISLQKNTLESLHEKEQETIELINDEKTKEVIQEEWGTEVKGEWTKNKSGGCMNYPTWRNNPQILLKSNEEGEITINLTQIVEEEEDNRQGIGFYVFNGSNFEELITTNGEIVSRSSFSKNDTISITCNLPFSEDGYVILPCTFHPNAILKFSLSIESNSTGAEIRMLTADDEFNKTSVEGEWKGKTAGGCRNFNSWLYNPQFYVPVKNECKIQFLLTQDQDDFDAIGIYIFKAPNGDCNSKITPQELLEKASFKSNRECAISFTVSDDIIVIPCTFHPEKESTFKLQMYTSKDNENITISALTDKKELSIEGEWNDSTAGGCTSFSTWRNNPQYVVTSKSKCDISLRLIQTQIEDKNFPIGIYVFKDTGRRRLLVKPEDVLKSTTCSTLEAITIELSNELWRENNKGEYSMVIMPCTFYPNQKTKFTLKLSSPNDIEEPIIDSYEPFYQHSMPSEWNSLNSGGCRNNFTWRNNPQFQFKAQKDAKIMCVLQLPDEKSDTKHSIGFYIVKALEGEKVFQFNEDNYVKKAPFRKSYEAYCPISIKEGCIYNVIPCTFVAGIESKFTFSIFSNENNVVSIEEVNSYSKITLENEWKEESAGGCLNNNTFWFNPKFALCVSEDVTITILLVQLLQSDDEMEIKAKGLYICKSDDNLDPLIENPDDLVDSTPFEQAPNVLLTTTISANDKPYILIPSTFYPGDEAKFEIYVYIKEDKASAVHLYPIVDVPATEIDEDISVEEIEEVEESEESETQPIEEPVEEPIEEHTEESDNSTKEEDTSKVDEEIEKLNKKIKEQEEEIMRLKEEIEKSKNNSLNNEKTINTEQVIENKVEPEIPNCDIPIAPALVIKPKTKPIKKDTVKNEKPQETTETVDVFQQIKEGKFLRKVKQSEKVNYKKREQEEFFKGFNMQKIIARRRAIEVSDDEEEDFSDHEDDDWW